MEISAPNAPSAEQALLTDAIAGAAGERISGFEITGSESDGDEGYLVTARVTQDSVTTTRVFHVERAGRAALVFPDWQMGQTEYAFLSMEIPSGTTSILVNGQEVAVDSLAVEDGFAVAAVLPGQYTVGLPASSEFVDAEESTVFVSADPDVWVRAARRPVLHPERFWADRGPVPGRRRDRRVRHVPGPPSGRTGTPSRHGQPARWSRAPAPGPSTPTRR